MHFVIEYCLPVYGHIVSLGDTERLHRVQDMCVKYVSGLKKFDQVSETKCLLPIADVCTLSTSCFINKILVSGRPRYLREIFRTTSEVRSQSTWQDYELE